MTRRRYYVAVDTGTGRDRPGLAREVGAVPGLEQHEVVAASVTRYLGYVRSSLRRVPGGR